jgi:2-isopropylmalate synthase
VQAQAFVRITVEERELSATATGDGPLAAAFTAIESLVEDHRIELQELTIQAITPGDDAVGDASLRARIDGKEFTGRGAAPDVVNAAVRAFLNALNKASVARDIEAEALARASYLWGV